MLYVERAGTCYLIGSINNTRPVKKCSLDNFPNISSSYQDKFWAFQYFDTILGTAIENYWFLPADVDHDMRMI